MERLTEKNQMFKLHNHFDVARLLGHPAFDHLAKACLVYSEVHDHNLIDPSVHDWSKCFDYQMLLTKLQRVELEACVHAVVLFQAMMEKVPYFVPTLCKELKPLKVTGFRESWDTLLDQTNSDDKPHAKDAFSKYYTDFYKGMRNPIIHGRDESDIEKVNSIHTALVHDGMKAGWSAYDYLLTEAFRANGESHEPSWSSICAMHYIPEVFDSNKFPNLRELSGIYLKRYEDGLSAATDAD